MANFLKSFEKTMGHEGGYIDDPDDKGGETYRGISRRWFPDWEGWVMIDKYKSKPSFPDSLKLDQKLSILVRDFYKIHFWNRFQGDSIDNQFIADELFDTAVNMDVTDAVKFLQKSLNLLNRNQVVFPDMTEDGIFGPTTLSNLNKYLSTEDSSILLKMMIVLQGNHYMEYMVKSPTQEKYCRGWFGRVEITKA